jgi:hypothetical protein
MNKVKDPILETSAEQPGWEGYAFQGTHAAYDFDVNHYANNASGVVFR